MGDAQVPQKTFAQAAWQIAMADISMSLDNVLAVSGAARDHPAVLVFGLGLSIVMMGVAASLIARMFGPAESWCIVSRSPEGGTVSISV